MMFYAIRVEIDCCFNLMKMKYNERMPVCQTERCDAKILASHLLVMSLFLVYSCVYSFRIRSSSRSMR